MTANTKLCFIFGTRPKINAHGIEKYYPRLTRATKIDYHKSLANTRYRNKQWHNARLEYRRLKQLGGANLKAWARMACLQFTNATGGEKAARRRG